MWRSGARLGGLGNRYPSIGVWAEHCAECDVEDIGGDSEVRRGADQCDCMASDGIRVHQNRVRGGSSHPTLASPLEDTLQGGV